MANGKYPGLLTYGTMTPEDKHQAVYSGLGRLGAALLKAGGPSTMPTSFAQALGQGGQAFTGGVRGYVDDARQRQLAELQRQKLMAEIQEAQAKAKTGGETFGKTPVWGTDAEGNPALGVVGDQGTFRPIDTGEFQPQRRAVSFQNIGGKIVGFDAFGQPVTEMTKTLSPEAEPATKRAQAEQTEIGKAEGAEAGAAKASLSAAEASLPRLETAVSELKNLGQKATYTQAGQAVDVARKELGLDPSEGAVARSAYVAHVKNNILPLLRQTFGAAFTAAEGESLLATMGDPDMHPREKEAVLDAFIKDKKADLARLKRQVGGVGTLPPSAQPGRIGSQITSPKIDNDGWVFEEVQ